MCALTSNGEIAVNLITNRWGAALGTGAGTAMHRYPHSVGRLSGTASGVRDAVT